MLEQIKNLPDYARNYRYIVVRLVDDDFWFYGAYNAEFKAIEVRNGLYDSYIIYNHEAV